MEYICFTTPERTVKVNHTALSGIQIVMTEDFLFQSNIHPNWEKVNFDSPMWGILSQAEPIEAAIKEFKQKQKTPEELYLKVRDWINSPTGHFFLLSIGGKELSLRNLVLNTVLNRGSKYLPFAVRLEGHRFGYAYIESNDSDRKYFIDVIKEALHHNYFKDQKQWLDVIDLIESRSEHDDPIVIYHSAYRYFPSLRGMANFSKRELEEWINLTPQQQWDRQLPELRKQEDRLRLDPCNWESYRFGDGLDAIKVMKILEQPFSSRVEIMNYYCDSARYRMHSDRIWENVKQLFFKP